MLFLAVSVLQSFIESLMGKIVTDLGGDPDNGASDPVVRKLRDDGQPIADMVFDSIADQFVGLGYSESQARVCAMAMVCMASVQVLQMKLDEETDDYDDSGPQY